MSHSLTGDDKFRDLIYGDDDRSCLTDRSNSPPVGYKFGRIRRTRVPARYALRRFNGYFQRMIEAIADAKLRRAGREPELRVRCDRPGDGRVERKSRPMGRS